MHPVKPERRLPQLRPGAVVPVLFVCIRCFLSVPLGFPKVSRGEHARTWVKHGCAQGSEFSAGIGCPASAVKGISKASRRAFLASAGASSSASMKSQNVFANIPVESRNS